MTRRIPLALAGGALIALLGAPAASAGSGLHLATYALIDRGEYPTSGSEIALIAIGVVILIAIGFLLRYLARPRKPRKAPEEQPPEDKTAED